MRRGAGVVLWIALGIVIVAGILLGAQYTVGKSSRQEAAAAYLGTRASAVLESCLDEATYRAFGEAAGRGSRRDLGEALRMYVAGAAKAADRDGWLARFDAPLPLTREAYQTSPDVKIAGARYGVIEQEPYPSAKGLKSNESRGLVAVESDVEIALPGAGLKIGRRGRQELEFKTVVVGLPWPFNRYTFFDRALPPDPAKPDRFYDYLARYRAQKAKKGALDPFAVLAMDEKDAPPTGPVYSTLNRVGDAQLGFRGWTIPAFWGENLLGGSPDEEMSDQMLLMARQMFRKASAKEAAELDKYYGQLDEEAWREKRTHVFPDVASFVGAVSKDGVLDLAGVYWIDGPVTLAHAYRGHGVIVSPHRDGIVVRKCAKDPAFDGHLTLVATAGDVRAAGNPAELHATLAAVKGTVRGLSQTKLYGTVYCGWFAADKEEGPEIQKPMDADWDPIAKVTDEPSQGLARRMRAFLVPRPVRRDFTVSRGRS